MKSLVDQEGSQLGPKPGGGAWMTWMTGVWTGPAFCSAADPGARLPGFESRLARLLLRDFTSEPQFPHLQSELQGADGRKCLEQGLAHSECWLSAW